MRKIYYIIITIFLVGIVNEVAISQTLPVGTAGLEEFYRRKQLLGQLDSSISFSVRPLNPSASLNVKNVFDPDSALSKNSYFRSSGPITFLQGTGTFQILPFSWQQQFNSKHPFGWNDGSMIPARGYQTMISGGLFVRFGPLSVQLRPELVYAENRSFEGFANGRSESELQSYYDFYNLIDEPERFGTTSYNKINWGQSSVRLTFGPASIGLSNENIWWGPGVQNALIFTNNASGFKHFTLNTVRPIKTPIGSFEGQIIAGRLENSGLPPLSQTKSVLGENLFKVRNPDTRYISGFNINYQPKWVPGLFVGFIRDFVSYESDVSRFKDYFPFFFPVQKKTTGVQGDPFARDQRLAMYARWLFPKAHAEVYFEYALNDNSYNYRDFIGSPDHARAYIFGITKLIPLKGRKDEYIQINGEIDQLSQSIDRLVRPSGGFYQHLDVSQGYTNLGQVLGAGTGSGGNLQSLSVSWVRGLAKIGVDFQRLEHNADFYELYIQELNGQSRRWVDYALAANGQWNYKNFIFNAKLQGIKSLNYEWTLKDYSPDEYYFPHNDLFNFHGEIGVTFRF